MPVSKHLIFVLAVFLAVAFDIRALAADPNCDLCEQSQGTCMFSPNGTWAGCCLSGTPCYGPGGNVVGCC
jgi:hypothetical protein